MQVAQDYLTICIKYLTFCMKCDVLHSTNMSVCDFRRVSVQDNYTLALMPGDRQCPKQNLVEGAVAAVRASDGMSELNTDGCNVKHLVFFWRNSFFCSIAFACGPEFELQLI